MNNNFQTLKKVKILFLLFFLLFLPLKSICQTVTASQAFAPGIDLNDHIQEITRDLQICDLVILERDAQARFITTLKSQVISETTERAKKEEQVTQLQKELSKFKLKTNRRGKIIGAGLLAILVRSALKFATK